MAGAASGGRAFGGHRRSARGRAATWSTMLGWPARPVRLHRGVPTPATRHMRLPIPSPSLVLLVGPTGSGKSTFAARHFAPTEVVSSDRCRAWVSDDESDQSASDAAFEVLRLLVLRRLERARLTVVDATSVQPGARAALLELARRTHLPAVALVFDLDLALLEARRVARAERVVPAEVLERQREQLHRGLDRLADEGFAVVHVLATPEAVAAAQPTREPLPPDRRHEPGPFDVVGDVHGCLDELCALLEQLGYRPDAPSAPAARDAGFAHAVPPWRHPAGRRVVFVGDLVDRGPRIADTLRLAMAMCEAGTALAVPGNHDEKLLRRLRGHAVHVSHGLEQTLAELDAAPPGFADRVRDFLGGLPSHLVLAEGALVVAHAGLPTGLQGRDSRRVRDHALFGETTGVPGADGLPMRLDWAARYFGRALVVYGHTPVLAPRWKHETVDIDTGCVFGGALTALRWPERELVQVPARRQYAVPGRPIAADPFVDPATVRAVRRSALGAAAAERGNERGAGARSGERRLPGDRRDASGDR